MKIEKRVIEHRSGTPGVVYDMITGQGLTVSILALGAAVQKISLRGDDGCEIPIALGFDDMRYYIENACFAGATLGPNAGRIRNGQLPVVGHRYQLANNDGPHQLHGGPHNLAGQQWSVESADCAIDSATLLLSAVQPDGLDGYPGNRIYHTRYTLEDTGWLSVEYHAGTDMPTYINMSNHTYWNLTGDFTLNAGIQQLKIFANNVCVNDADHLPADIIPVTDTAFDFTGGHSILNAARTAADPVSREQLQISQGYNHAFILNKNQACRRLRSAKRPKLLHNACTLTDPDSGRTLKMLTDAPALVLYTGGFLPDNLCLHGGVSAGPSCAIALEAQDVPDVMHLLPDYYQLTTPEQPFQRMIRYHIS